LSEYCHGNSNAIVAKGAAGAWWQISPQTDLLAEREREKERELLNYGKRQAFVFKNGNFR